MFPLEVFETATQRRVLRVLAEKNKQYTIEELAEMCHRSEASISRALRNADRYPFIEKDHVPGSKRLTFRLDPESRYTAVIREFFEIERDQERQGTVPVDVWNLLEDVADQLSDLDEFVELFLFGSYATGEYYAGSDIDLLLAHTSATDITEMVNEIVERIGDDRLHVIPVEVDAGRVDQGDENVVFEAVTAKAPVRNVDTVIPLTGEVAP